MIAFASIILSLYLFESYLIFGKQFIFKKQSLKEELYLKQTGKKWDKRKRYEIYNDLKKINNEIVLTVAPHIYYNDNKLHPLSGISNSETINCNENGYYSIYKSDRYGFNNPDEEWDKNEIQYLLVGDSFTQGHCVNRPNDIGSILRILSNKSVLNLGYGGNGPLIEYALLREYLNSNVNKVLWLYSEGNDLTNLAKSKKNKVLINYLNDLNFSQNLKFRQNEINDLAIDKIETQKKRKKESDNLKFSQFIKIYNLRNIVLHAKPPVVEPESATLEEFKKIIDLADRLVKKNNSKLYFVYLPVYGRFNTDVQDMKYINKKYYDVIKKIVIELNIPFIDISKEVFEKEENPLIFFPFESRGHYNIEGYKKVTEAIYKNTKN